MLDDLPGLVLGERVIPRADLDHGGVDMVGADAEIGIGQPHCRSEESVAVSRYGTKPPPVDRDTMMFTRPPSTNHSGAHALVVNGDSDGPSSNPADPTAAVAPMSPCRRRCHAEGAAQRQRDGPHMLPGSAVGAARDTDGGAGGSGVDDVVPAVGVPHDARVPYVARRRPVSRLAHHREIGPVGRLVHVHVAGTVVAEPDQRVSPLRRLVGP